jgi:hypothetical protein
MTLDQIDRMVRQANPVPDLSALEPIDASFLDEQRRSDMQTHDRVIVEDEGGEPKRGRNLLIGIAAAAAIIIGALLLLRPLTEAPPVADQPTTTSAVETAKAFVEAYRVNFDIDRAFSYLAANAEGIGPLEEERLFARFLQAIGSKTFLGSCEELSSSPTGALVSCSFEHYQLRSDEMGLGPYGGGSYELTVLGQRITSFNETFPPNFTIDPNGFSEQVWVPFSDWIATTYPEDGAIMYDDWPTAHSWAITDESIALWEQRSREYVEVVKAGPEAVGIATDFLDAFRNYDSDLAASYLVGDAMNEFGGDLAGMRFDLRFDQATGFQLISESCEARKSLPTGTLVHCTYEYHDLRSDEIGLGPFGGDWYDFTVQDGKILSVEAFYNFMNNGFSDQMWEPFASWVAENHPEDGQIMYAEWPVIFSPASTEESMALWEQRTREYVEVVRGTSG